MHNDYNDTLPSYSNQSLAAAAGDWQTSQSSLCSAQVVPRRLVLQHRHEKRQQDRQCQQTPTSSDFIG